MIESGLWLKSGLWLTVGIMTKSGLWLSRKLWLSRDYDWVGIMTESGLWLSRDYDWVRIMTESGLWLSRDYDWVGIMTESGLWLSRDYDWLCWGKTLLRQDFVDESLCWCKSQGLQWWCHCLTLVLNSWCGQSSKGPRGLTSLGICWVSSQAKVEQVSSIFGCDCRLDKHNYSCLC